MRTRGSDGDRDLPRSLRVGDQRVLERTDLVPARQQPARPTFVEQADGNRPGIHAALNAHHRRVIGRQRNGLRHELIPGRRVVGDQFQTVLVARQLSGRSGLRPGETANRD